MRINCINSYKPAFCAQFSNDKQTKAILKNQIQKSSHLYWAYLVYKYMPQMGDGTVSLKPIKNDMIELSNSATGNSVQYPKDAFFFNMLDMISVNAFEQSYLNEYQLIESGYDHDCKKFFGTDQLVTEPDVLLLNQAIGELQEKAGTTPIHNQMADIIATKRKLHKKDKANKEVLDYQFDILYSKAEKQEKEYMLSLVG